MNETKIKEEIIKSLNGLDFEKLNAVYGAVLNIKESAGIEQDWLDLSPKEQSGILEAIIQSDNNAVLKHNEVISRIKKDLQ